MSDSAACTCEPHRPEGRAWFAHQPACPLREQTPLEQDVNRAFRLWCAEADLAIDYTAPHWEAFQAGYEAGCEDEYHRYLRSAVT